MDGIVPTSGFICWFPSLVFPQKGMSTPKYSAAEIESDIASRRRWIHFNFVQSGNTGTGVESLDNMTGPVTQSAVDCDDKWMLNKEAFNMEPTHRRRLSRVPLEHLCIAAKKKQSYFFLSV